MTTQTKTRRANASTLAAGPLVFPTRAKRFETAAAKGRYWESECGRYRVRESHVKGYAVRFVAQFRVIVPTYHAPEAVSYWDTISKHKLRETAEAACQHHARENGDD